jgi:Protein of unknown function (DUF1580)
MPIDLKSEKIIDALKQAPSYLGTGRNGKFPHKSFVLRAIKKGHHGFRLEALRVGNRWITSVEALQRWAEAQTEGAATRLAGAPVKSGRKAAEQAARELDRLGI